MLSIDVFFPAGVHQLTHHARLSPAGHTFLGHARPRPNNTPQPDLGLIERPARRTKPMPLGVMGHLPGNSCTLRTRPVSRPSYLLQQGRRLSSPTRRAPLSRWRLLSFG